MLTILYPYRNRETERVKRSLDSLIEQTNHDFRVILVDYGSNVSSASEIKELVSSYTFATYIYNFSELQPWSRAKAINIGLRNVTTDYVFTADVDMIFSPNFIAKLQELKNPLKAYYFKVGFLNEKESLTIKPFDNYTADFSSGVGAQGLSLFSIEEIRKINGYDEFLHFWGAEDIDIHNRLERIGVESVFYDTEILMLHQWHKSYRREEKHILAKDLQLTNVVQINHHHLLFNNENEKTAVNNENWGNGFCALDFQELKEDQTQKILLNKVEVITHFLFYELANFKNGILNVGFVKDDFQGSLKYKMKKILGKKVPKYYSLKEINDLILLHVISFYHTSPYSYEISDDLKKITFKIKK